MEVGGFSGGRTGQQDITFTTLDSSFNYSPKH